MKTYGKMSIAFLYDDETDTIVNEPILESSKQNVSDDVLQRIYIALGMHLHGMLARKRYCNEDIERIETQHAELIEILESKE